MNFTSMSSQVNILYCLFSFDIHQQQFYLAQIHVAHILLFCKGLLLTGVEL